MIGIQRPVNWTYGGLDGKSLKNGLCRIKVDTVASLRLDAVLSAAFGLSRSRAGELIAAGQVNLNYVSCLQPAKELSEGAVLSVRGMGRAVLTEIGGESRKGRIFIKIGLYGR